MNHSRAQVIGIEEARGAAEVATSSATSNSAEAADPITIATLSLRQEMSWMMATLQGQINALEERVETSLAAHCERSDDLAQEVSDSRQTLGEQIEDTRYELELTNQRLTAELDDMLVAMRGGSLSGNDLSKALLALAERTRAE